MKFLLLLAAALAAFPQSSQRPPASATEALYRAAADSAERKLRHIEQNGRRAHPDQRPTVLTQREINAYLASGRVDLPQGVKRVDLAGVPGVVKATARVDFDEIRAARPSSNPLLGLFSGTHDVHVTARANGSGGEGHVHVQSVDIDGVGVPRMALEYFVNHYIKPKHPEIGMDSTFELPDKIDLAVVGDGELTVTQK